MKNFIFYNTAHFKFEAKDNGRLMPCYKDLKIFLFGAYLLQVLITSCRSIDNIAHVHSDTCYCRNPFKASLVYKISLKIYSFDIIILTTERFVHFYKM